MPLIEIYTKDQCPMCQTAKLLLNSKNIPYTEYLIGKDITREEVLERFPEARMAPVITLDGKMIKEATTFQLLLEGKEVTI